MVRHLGHHRRHVGEHQSAGRRPRADSTGREQRAATTQPIEMLVPIDSQSRTNAVLKAEMKLQHHNISQTYERRRNGSVLIIVLWVCIGLVGIALYFANSMTYELRASDNRASGLATDQAIEGAARYVSYVLATYATNGVVPATNLYVAAAVPVGDARFWLIGRDPSGTPSSEPCFGLITSSRARAARPSRGVEKKSSLGPGPSRKSPASPFSCRNFSASMLPGIACPEREVVCRRRGGFFALRAALRSERCCGRARSPAPAPRCCTRPTTCR